MADGRYFVADVVLSALLVLSNQDCLQLFAAFDQIAGDPIGSARATGSDWDGRMIYLSRHGRFEIGYVVSPDGTMVTFTMIRPISTRR